MYLYLQPSRLWVPNYNAPTCANFKTCTNQKEDDEDEVAEVQVDDSDTDED